ncbi:hypothetical protein DFP72DRAFT_871576 [Ephemerocybe angulata]|uniref:Uncharacterized protein n=1 Tax=Ephemerocybe angulata TaxID=980116 RepID=A0A8H6IEX3_9AGAR|nr:hypothetical protein DFP72DRAFT_871576 [Tulosesus angulatus]
MCHSDGMCGGTAYGPPVNGTSMGIGTSMIPITPDVTSKEPLSTAGGAVTTAAMGTITAAAGGATGTMPAAPSAGNGAMSTGLSGLSASIAGQILVALWFVFA